MYDIHSKRRSDLDFWQGRRRSAGIDYASSWIICECCLHLQARICAPPKLSLEQLDSNDGKHEEKEDGDHQDVPNVLHGGHHALHHMLQPSCSVDGSRKKKHEWCSSETNKKHLTSVVWELVWPSGPSPLTQPQSWEKEFPPNLSNQPEKKGNMADPNHE